MKTSYSSKHEIKSTICYLTLMVGKRFMDGKDGRIRLKCQEFQESLAIVNKAVDIPNIS